MEKIYEQTDKHTHAHTQENQRYEFKGHVASPWTNNNSQYSFTAFSWSGLLYYVYFEGPV